MIRKIVVGERMAVGLLAAPAAAQDSPASVLPARGHRATGCGPAAAHR